MLSFIKFFHFRKIPTVFKDYLNKYSMIAYDEDTQLLVNEVNIF